MRDITRISPRNPLCSIKDIRRAVDLSRKWKWSLKGSVALWALGMGERAQMMHSFRLYKAGPQISFAALPFMPNLAVLDLRHAAPWLVSLYGLSGCKALRRLDLSGCTRLTDLTGLIPAPNLETVSLNDCTALPNVNGLSELPRLRDLTLRRCVALENIDDLARSPTLDSLDLTDCSQLTSIDAVSTCSKLETISLLGCSALNSIAPLDNLNALKFLYVDLPSITEWFTTDTLVAPNAVLTTGVQ